MLKTVKVSTNRKTGPIAVTYRSGEHNVFGTCPKTCALNPAGEHSAELIDDSYLAAIVDSVPRGGLAWTYSHFALKLLPKPQAGLFVVFYAPARALIYRLDSTASLYWFFH